MTSVLNCNRPLKTVFCMLYFINAIGFLGVGGLRIPGFPLNLVQVTGILLIILCFIIDNRIFWDKYQRLFWLFMLFYAVSSWLTGYLTDFLSTLANTIFGVVSIYWSTRILIRDYNVLWPLLIPVAIIACLDSTITMFQCLGYHQLDFIPYMLGTYNEDIMAYMDRKSMTYGQSLNGLFLNPVLNGHYLLFMFSLLLICIKDKLVSLKIIFPAIALIGLFFCQQRSAFFWALIVLVFFLFSLLKRGNIRKSLFIPIVIIALITLFSGNFLERIVSPNGMISDSRLLNLEDTGRNSIYDNSLNFITSHLLFGGHFKFIAETNMPPHNLLLDAFIAGGFFGGIVLIVMIVKQITLVLRSFNKHSIICLVYGLCFLSMIGDAMFHNSGYTTGDKVVWLSWALFISQIEFEDSFDINKA